MSWYTRPQDSSLASCKHYHRASSTQLEPVSASHSGQRPTILPRARDACSLTLDCPYLPLLRGICMVFSCVSLASTIWVLEMFQSPQETSDESRKITAILWDNLLQCWGRSPTELLPSVMVQGKNLLEELWIKLAFRALSVWFAWRSLSKVLYFLWLLSLPCLPQSVLILIFPSKNFVFIYFILESHAIPSFLNISNHCTFTSVNYTACVFTLNKF